MLYQLIRRDNVWKDGRWGLGLCAALCLIPRIGSMDMAAVYGPLYVIGALFIAMPQRRAKVFEAVLPIPARTLFLARSISVLGLIWLTAAVAVLAYSVTRGVDDTAFKTVAMASFGTLGAAVLLCFRHRYLTGPWWLFLLVYMCALFTFVPVRVAPAVSIACILTGLGMILLTWRAMPKSFQLPVARRAEPSYGRVSFVPAFPWMPVVRSVFSPLYLFWCVTAAAAALAGAWLAAAFSIGFSWLTLRQSIHWVRTLPIRTRAVLLTFALPMMAVCGLGQFANFHIALRRRAPLQPPAQIVEFGGLLAWLLVIWLMYASIDWRPVRRMCRYTGVVVLAVGACIPLAGWIFTMRRGVAGFDPLHEAVLNMATSFPGGWGGAVLLVTIVLATLWWTLEKVVSQSEYTDVPRNATETSIMARLFQ